METRDCSHEQEEMCMDEKKMPPTPIIITSCSLEYSVAGGNHSVEIYTLFLLLLTYSGLFPSLFVTENSIRAKKTVLLK